jgi:hypothetical protein
MKFCWAWRGFLLLPGLAAAQGRVVVPVAQIVLPDGDTRFSVPVRVGNSDVIQALLDTGSTGLRVLPNAVPQDTYTSTGFASLYAYGSGDVLSGVIATAPVSIGGAVTDAAVPIEMVNAVGCSTARPDCGAAKVALNDYGIGGDGIAGQGFKAILGISLMPATGAGYTDNPLLHIGAKRWILDLPEPGSAADGALILNPDDGELQGYQLFHLTPLAAAMPGQDGGWQDLLPGCLNNVSTDQSICGATMLDTGTPGVIAYHGSDRAPLWSPGDNTALQFATGGSGNLSFSFAADRFPGSGLLREPDNGQLTLVAGMLPFFAYSVFYDAANGVMGLKPRDDVPDMQNVPAGAVDEDSDTQIEVIKMNAPGASAPVAPASGGMVLPQVITPTP